MNVERRVPPAAPNPNQPKTTLGQLGVLLVERAEPGGCSAAQIADLDRISQLDYADKSRELRIFAQSLEPQDIEWALREFVARDLDAWDLFEGRNDLRLSNETALLLIENDYHGVLSNRLDLFLDGLDASILYAITPSLSQQDVGHIDKFTNIDIEYFLQVLLDHHRTDIVLKVIAEHQLSDTAATRVALRLINEDQLRTTQVDEFMKLNFDPLPIVRALVATNESPLLARLLRQRPIPLDSDLLVQVHANIGLYNPARSGTNAQARHKYMHNVCRCIEAILPHTRLEQNSEAWRIAFVYQRLRGILAEHIEGQSLREALDIYEGRPSQKMKELGITSSGAEGLDQLEAWAQNFPAYFNDDDKLVAMIQGTQFGRQLFQRHVHFTDAPNTRATQLLFNERLSLFCEEAADPLDNAYRPSQIYNIPRQYQEEALSEDERTRYAKLLQALMSAVSIATRGHGAISGWAHEFEQQLQYMDELLQASAAESHNANPKAQSGIAARREQFGAINPFSVAQFEQNFLSLVSSKAMHENLLIAMFTIGLQRQRKSTPNWRGDLQEFLSERLSSVPTPKSIACLRSMVHDIKEYFDELFTTPQARKAFAVLASTDALDAGLRRIEAIKLPTVAVRFEPTRGLLMQYSDFIAQTCWLDLDSYFAEKHPDVVTVMIRQEPGQKRDGLVGGFLLIQGDTESGERLLIARSINPRETWINSVQPEPFYQAVTEYICAQAAALQRTPVICLGGKVREFATNRFKLHQHMPVGDPTKKVTGIILTDDVNFNGYGKSVQENAYRL